MTAVAQLSRTSACQNECSIKPIGTIGTIINTRTNRRSFMGASNDDVLPFCGFSFRPSSSRKEQCVAHANLAISQHRMLERAPHKHQLQTLYRQLLDTKHVLWIRPVDGTAGHQDCHQHQWMWICGELMTPRVVLQLMNMGTVYSQVTRDLALQGTVTNEMHNPCACTTQPFHRSHMLLIIF